MKHEHFATPVKSGLVMDMDYDGPEIHTPTEYDEKPLIGKRSPVQRGIAQIKGVVKAFSRRSGEQPTSLEISMPHKTRPGPYDTRPKHEDMSDFGNSLRELKFWRIHQWMPVM